MPDVPAVTEYGTIMVTVEPTEPTHVDELCPTCWLPTIWTFDLLHIQPAGITLVGTWHGCIDCDD